MINKVKKLFGSSDPRILIIEPHGDDALISASTIIDRGIRKGYKIDIATIGHSRDSSRLKEYYDIDKITYYDLPEIDYKLKPKINTYDIHKMYQDHKLYCGYVSYRIMYYVKNSLDSYDNVYYDTDNIIFNLLEEYQKDKRNVIVTPYGLDHPYHIMISKIVEDYIHKYGLTVAHIMYLDKPYTSKRYIKETVAVDTEYRVETLYEIGLGSLATLKEETFKSVYPTEKSLLRFTKDSVLTDPDSYVVSSHSYSEDVFCRLFDIKEIV